MQKFMQIKNYLHELSFLALLIKFMFLGAGIGEALVAIILVISMAYNKWLTKVKVDQYEELKELISKKTDIGDFKEMQDQFKNVEGRLNNFALEKSTKRVAPNEESVPVPGIKRRNF